MVLSLGPTELDSQLISAVAEADKKLKGWRGTAIQER